MPEHKLRHVTFGLYIGGLRGRLKSSDRTAGAWGKLLIVKMWEILSSVDKEGQGAITIEQYVSVMKENIHLATKTTRIRDFFSRFDDNKDGRVPINSVFRGFETMGFEVDDELKEKILKMDTNGDGLISYSEFLHAQLLQKNILRASESQ
ncbi:hypothetical protein FSP39_024653 [Pinctada imbricata]|uniref:EF-hand domain-containing protein n=1 Tax=Pinctada imbricata TaxID=66713 RepID=A0AA88XNV7_PINIB|nr:hypothetical protein FSP39_024653 [Pinctada imbricata]